MLIVAVPHICTQFREICPQILRADINFENGRVFIRESKHYKERVVYAPDSLMPIILEYMKDIDCIFESV